MERAATGRRRRPTRSGVVLSAGLIVDTAVALTAEHGAEALTVRRLGEALGCDPSAVYRYFRGADDLLLAVYDRLIGETFTGFTLSDDWVCDLREIGLRAYRALMRDPRLAAVAASRVTRREHEIRVVETGVGLLRGAGLSPGDALRGYLSFIDTVLGFAALDAAAESLSPEAREGDLLAWTGTYARLPAEAYPNIAAARGDLADLTGSTFGQALELVLSGLRAAAGAGRLP